MAYDGPNTMLRLVAAAAIRKGQICKLSSSQATPCTVAGEAFTGVAIADAVAGGPVTLVVNGEVDVETADTSPIMTEVMTDANGRAVAKTSTNVIVGLLLEPGLAVSGSVGAPARLLVRSKLSV